MFSNTCIFRLSENTHSHAFQQHQQLHGFIAKTPVKKVASKTRAKASTSAKKSKST